MKNFKYLIGFLSFVFSNYAVAQGCALNYGTPNELIYYGALPTGTRNFGTPIAYNDASNTAYPNACPKYDYLSASTNGQSCRINGSLVGNYYIPASRLIFVPCPLDDYVSHLILAFGSFGLMVLRRRNLLNIT
ncbi:hypothetical protein GCM10022246_07650 [Pedobacter ginsengiterrae]|uniref:IPTL-CTERM protein sorting domain-containing protein n=1 Tax=Pedobacter ginsengiterrae TaxID=871696 RepID=A0ABP7NXR1_9SPHI